MASGPQCLVLDDAASILAVSSEAEVGSPSAGELGCVGQVKFDARRPRPRARPLPRPWPCALGVALRPLPLAPWPLARLRPRALGEGGSLADVTSSCADPVAPDTVASDSEV